MLRPKFHKVVFVGAAGTGKTSIVASKLWPNQPFSDLYQCTIGIDYVQMMIRASTDDKPRSVEIWDTAGQEKYAVLINGYIRNARILCVVYNITDRKSFDAIDSYIDTARNEQGQDLEIILIGNKLDLLNQREVSKAEGLAKAFDLGCKFKETSAATAWHVNDLFADIAAMLPHNSYVASIIDGIQPDLVPIDTLYAPANTKSCCWLM